MESSLKVLKEKAPPYRQMVLDFPWEDRKVYAYWLAETYRYVDHTVKLLSLAASQTQGPMRECMLHHEREEMGHELLALNDLKALGYQLEDFPLNPETEALYKTVYNELKTDVCGLIAYAMAQEALSAQCFPIVEKKLIAAHGRRASSFVILHAKVDQEHSNDTTVLELLSESQLKRMEPMVVAAMDRYKAFLEAITSGVGVLAA